MDFPEPEGPIIATISPSFTEKLTLRKRAITTQEVANAAVFLLSPVSSGINGQTLVVNAGMDFNYFDEEVVNKSV